MGILEQIIRFINSLLSLLLSIVQNKRFDGIVFDRMILRHPSFLTYLQKGSSNFFIFVHLHLLYETRSNNRSIQISLYFQLFHLLSPPNIQIRPMFILKYRCLIIIQLINVTLPPQKVAQIHILSPSNIRPILKYRYFDNYSTHKCSFPIKKKLPKVSISLPYPPSLPCPEYVSSSRSA